jgi:hypothetical protein
MRRLRLVFLLLVTLAFLGACASTTPGAGTQPPVVSQAPAGAPSTVVSQPPIATQPPAASPGGKGSISYQITGEYTASGELPYTPHDGSYFTAGEGGGWLVLFAEDPQSRTDYLWLRTRESSQEIQFGAGGATVDVLGSSNLHGCAFTSTKNDASGLTGNAVCTKAELWKDEGRTVLKITFSAQWDAQP